MTMIDTHRPPTVTDEFVLELRTRAARNPALPIRPLTGREVAASVRYALDEDQELPLDLSAMKRIVIDPPDGLLELNGKSA